ncbi:MAG: hypothetical protein ACREQK_18295 [Candidatus Binatia bacterium]
MNPLLVFAIPIVLVIIGMILNSIGLSFDQPASSSEQDPARRLDAERQSYRKFFDQQRTMFLKRQARVGQYAWLVLLAFVVSSGWIYFDTVNKTTLSTQIAALQTLPTEEGKDMVLSVTLSDGSNAKYLVKLKKADIEDAAKQSKEKVSSWELSRLGTAFSVGDGTLPLGVALKISN